VRPLAFAAVLASAVLLAGAAGTSAPAAPACTPTLDDGAGPFGRGAPPRRAKIGTGHVLTGIVLSSVDCRPLAGAAIHLWQANRRGEYTRAGSATVITNAAGRFRFEGPRPVSYEGRPAHIHLRVAAKNHELLHTRYVLATRKTTRGSIRLVLLPQRL
jgi:protocatechuate 3,4-dioxygenase beta subunit